MHSRSRMGRAADFLGERGVEVEVLDHHAGGGERHDFGPGVSIDVQDVGALTTVIVERLRAGNVPIETHHATLFAIAIHEDTGSLTFESTTTRDIEALAWLSRKGACQRSIAHFSRNCFSPDQQRLLTTALDTMVISEINGYIVASCLAESSAFVKGSSAVTQACMELSSADVFLMAVMTPASRAGRRAAAAAADGEACPVANVPTTQQISIIGRAKSRVESVDFPALFAHIGGGGHAKAASASVKAESAAEARDCVDDLVAGLERQMPDPIPCSSFMSRDVATVRPSDTMATAQALLFERGHTGLAVVSEGEHTLVGMISRSDIERAQWKKMLHLPVGGFVRKSAVVSIRGDTPLYEAERLLVQNKIGRLPVVNGRGEVVGIVTRSDVLLQRRFS